MKKTIIATAVAYAVLPTLSFSQQSTDLENILISAARTPITASEFGSSITILDESILNARPNISLGELLRSVAGVSVSRNSVHGSQTQLRMRGGEANQVLVFIDGVEANDAAQSSEFNFSHLLNYDIESVEVIRGPQSALWGSDALSGVISITTRQASEGFQGDIFAEDGSNNWQQLGASARYGSDKLRTKISLSHADTDGENISLNGSEEDGYRNDTASMSASYFISDSFSVNAKLRLTNTENDFDSVDFSTGFPADSDNFTESDQLYSRLFINWKAFEGHQSLLHHVV